MTVRELKQILNTWPEVDSATGEDSEVWITTEKFPHGTSITNEAKSAVLLNHSDLLLEF